MTPFTYGDFYDVPRQIILKYREEPYVWLSAFDDQLDDYPDSYQVFLVPLPSRMALSIPGQQFLMEAEQIGAKLLGSIPVKEVRFDPSLRRELDASFLDKYLKLNGLWEN